MATYQAALRLWPAPHCALEYHRWLFRSRFRGDGRQFHRYMQRPVAQPVCVVNGADDPALPRGGADRSQRQVTGPYETHALPGVGHFRTRRRPTPSTTCCCAGSRRPAGTSPQAQSPVSTGSPLVMPAAAPAATWSAVSA